MGHIDFTFQEGIAFYTYFSIAAVILGIVIAGVTAYRQGMKFSVFATIVATGMLFLIIGGKLILLDTQQWIAVLTEGRFPIVQGKSVVGAIVGGMIGVWIAGICFGYKGSVLNLFAIPGLLGLAVQRLGCLFAGCCHGEITSMPWGITYGPGSLPFREQFELGLIPADAITSMAVQPNQLFNIISCLIMVIIVWKTGSRWKSPSGKFIFSALLYLTFRFTEEFLRYDGYPGEGDMLDALQWKMLLIMIPLAIILFIRERNYAGLKLSSALSQPKKITNEIIIQAMTLGILFTAIRIGSWLTTDEQTLVILVIMPLCCVVLIAKWVRILIAQRLIGKFGLVAFGFILMSQTTDKPQAIPKSYTSFNLSETIGRFNSEHGFNFTPPQPGSGCEGTDTWERDQFIYKHAYKVLSAEVGRKIYYDSKRSLTTSVQVMYGQENEIPYPNSEIVFQPPHFKNTLWGIHSMINYDKPGLGLGAGVSLGHLGYDQRFRPSENKDYDPKDYLRNSGLQGRLRLFNEQKLFFEILTGYNEGAVGESGTRVFIGSRFGTDNFLFKSGLGWPRHGGRTFNIQTQIPFSDRLIFSSEYMVKYINDPYYSTSDISPKNGYRMSVGLEYRIHDQKKRHRK